MAKVKSGFGGAKKMKVGGSTSKPSVSKPSGYKDLRDMLDGGGPGRSGSTFSGGPLSGFGNAMGIKPLAPRAAAPSGGGGGADSGQAAARQQAQREAGAAIRNYKGNPDNFGQSRDGLGGISAGGAAATPVAPATTKAMRSTYTGGPPAGYKHGESPEWNYFKTDSVDVPLASGSSEAAKPMKSGGAIRGYGCATRGIRKARMV